MERATGPERDSSETAEATAEATPAHPERPADLRERFRRVDRSLAPAFDGILDGILIGFALWTLCFHLAAFLGLRADVTLVLWGASLIAAALAAHRVLRTRGTESPTIDVAIGTTSRVALSAVGVAIASATLFHLKGSAWTAFWVAVVGFTLIGVRTVMVSPRGRRSPVTPRGAALVLLAALAMGAFAVGGQYFNPDDIALVNRSTVVENDDGEAFPMRDTLYSDEVFPFTRPDDPPTSIEPLIGVLARATPLDAPQLAYWLIAPLVVACSVLALHRLLRTLRAPDPVTATLVGAAFLVLAGDQVRSPTIALLSAHQGKFILPLLLIPSAWHHALAWGRDGDRRSLTLLAACGIAGVGLSSTALFLVPPVIAAGVLAGVLGGPRATGRLQRLAGTSLALAYPLAAGLFALVAGPQPALAPAAARPARLLAVVAEGPPLFGYPPTAPDRVWWINFGNGIPALITTAAVLLAWLTARDRAGRLALLFAPLMLFGFALATPVFDTLAGAMDSHAIIWRLPWMLPVAAAVGLAATAPLTLRTPHRSAVTLAVVIALFLALITTGRPVTDRYAAWRAAPPPLDLRAGYESFDRAADRLVSLSGGSGTVAAPPPVEELIAIRHPEVKAVNPRPADLSFLGTIPEFHAGERATVTAALRLNGSIPKIDPERFAAALNTLDVRAVCIVSARFPNERRIMRAAGYSPAGELRFCSFWTRDDDVRPTTTS